jgi:hypothetical protein
MLAGRLGRRPTFQPETSAAGLAFAMASEDGAGNGGSGGISGRPCNPARRNQRSGSFPLSAGPTHSDLPCKIQASMTLSQIKYFLAVCEQKSFTNAARRCAVSQPSLTNAIKALENELGSTLFNRKPQAQPTTVGRALQPHFQSIIEAVDKTLQIAGAMNNEAQRAGTRSPQRCAPRQA